MKKEDINDEFMEDESVDEDEVDKASEGVARVMEKIVLFKDQFDEPHALLPDKERSCVPLQSKVFSRWLLGFLLKAAGQIKGASSMVKMLEAKSIDSPKYDLDVRIANRDGSIWYDLGDGRAVCINKSGWEIKDNFPIMFRKLKHQKPQVEPIRGGDIKELLEFVNIPGSSEMMANQLLFLVSVVFDLIPDHPHPIMVLHGPQGSAKTTAFKILKQLIDPSHMGTMSLSDNHRELVQLASHHYLLTFDNTSYLSTETSDILCRICTGDGFSKRQLFSDDEDVIYSYHRIIGLNGINIAPNKADLLDRCLLIGFERLEPYESERSFWPKFENAKSRILGAMFDVLVGALQKIDSVPEPGKLRMADFGQYGCAIAQAMGLSSDKFLSAYRNNLDVQNEEALSASPIGLAVRELMKNQEQWEGTATELSDILDGVALGLNIDIKARTWPKEARWVWRRIQEVKTNLEYAGIIIDWHKTSSKLITITRADRNVENVTPDIMDRMDI